MTIRLTDIEAQAEYAQKIEAYREAVDKRLEQPSAPSGWPSVPKQPSDMVNSEDESSPAINPFGLVASSPAMGGSDLRPTVAPSQDGNAHSDPKGYESRYSAEMKSKPFTLKK